MKNIIHRTNVTSTVKNNTNASEDFLHLVVTSYVVAAAMKYLKLTDMEGTPDTDIVRQDLWTCDKEERQKFLNLITSKIIDELVDFTFSNRSKPVSIS